MLLHTSFAHAIACDGRAEAVIVESKSGRQAIRPKLVIDCSADADVAARLGAPFVKGRASDGAMQPVTLFFRIGGVDVPALRRWMKQNRHLLKDSPADEEIDSQKALAVLGLHGIVKQAMETGELDADVAPRLLLYQLPREGQFAVNCTRLQGIDGTDASQLTRAEVQTRRQAWQLTRFMRRTVGGFEGCYIVDTGVQVGVRETRHIVGDYTMTDQDVLTSRAFHDGIACGAFAIDIHPPEGEKQVFTGSGKAVYEIPYRSLTPRGLDNVLVAGRCISASHEAFGSVRVMATAMAIGQGAGTAAAMAVRDNLTTRQVDTDALRDTLVRQGQYLLNVPLEPVVDASLRLHRAGGSGVSASHHNPFADHGHG